MNENEKDKIKILDVSELFTSKVFSKEVLTDMNEKVIKPKFAYNDIDEGIDEDMSSIINDELEEDLN